MTRDATPNPRKVSRVPTAGMQNEEKKMLVYQSGLICKPEQDQDSHIDTVMLKVGWDRWSVLAKCAVFYIVIGYQSVEIDFKLIE